MGSEEQVPTIGITLEEVMAWPHFALGAADARAGKPYRREYNSASWSTNDRWMYERGRMWAACAPRHVVLKRNGQVTAEAMRYFDRDNII
jgi:hypothetical protein